MKEGILRLDGLTVGYGRTPLLGPVDLTVCPGQIVTLIGPNGAGKSTILKSITKQISKIHGAVYFDKNEISSWSQKDMAKKVAVVLTRRIDPELMTCAEVVATGRYPYTNLVGRLTPEDKKVVEESMKRVQALDLAEQEFTTLSDGQKQRILLARALCQEPEVIVLDEPTAYLDVRHKIELLAILREMARDKKITIIMSLHEIDLATKISDYIMCVKGDKIDSFGTPEELFGTDGEESDAALTSCDRIEQLYDMEKGSYNNNFGSVELEKAEGAPKVFVVAGGGYGIPVYRALQKRQIPFATGIIYENDIDCEVAKALSDHVIKAAPFEPVDDSLLDEAVKIMVGCEQVIDAGTPIGTLNRINEKLLEEANEKGIPVYREADSIREIEI